MSSSFSHKVWRKILLGLPHFASFLCGVRSRNLWWDQFCVTKKKQVLVVVFPSSSLPIYNVFDRLMLYAQVGHDLVWCVTQSIGLITSTLIQQLGRVGLMVCGHYSTFAPSDGYYALIRFMYYNPRCDGTLWNYLRVLRQNRFWYWCRH